MGTIAEDCDEKEEEIIKHAKNETLWQLSLLHSRTVQQTASENAHRRVQCGKC